MRGKRAKQYRKLMRQYALTFGFREPYQVLVDAQMLQDAGRFSMSLKAAFERTLSAEVKPMITQCSIRHLYALPSSDQQKEACIATAKTFERRRCNHHTLDEPLSTKECLTSVIDPKSTRTDKDLVNKFNYVVAVQDEEVRRWCRGVKGVPLIFVKRSVMIMEPMAEGSERVRDGVEKGKFRAGLRNKVSTQGTKRTHSEANEGNEDDGAGNTPAKANKTSRGPKGPNPLSVKKPKKEIRDLKKDDASIPAHTNPDRGALIALENTNSADPENYQDDVETTIIGDERQKESRRRKRRHKGSTAPVSEELGLE